jgi:tetratricopeptide (TPR) repeat protein
MCNKPTPWLAALFLSAGVWLSSASQAAAACNVSYELAKTELLLKEKRYADGAAKLDRLRECAGLSPLETFQIGWLYGRSRRFKEALAVVNSVPLDVPDPRTHQYTLALCSFELGDYTGVLEALKNPTSGWPMDPEVANLMGVANSKLGRYKEAETIFLKEIQQNVQDLNAYLNLTTLYAEQKELAAAASIASQAADLFPNVPEVFIARGAVSTLLGHLDLAHNDFSMAAKLAPKKADPRFFLALTYYKERKYADAIQSLESAHKSGIVDSDLHYLLAECLLKVDASRPEAVMLELGEAIRLNTNSVPARTLRGKLSLEAGHAKEAVADLEPAYQRDPESRSATYILARAYRALGRTKESERLFSQLRNQRPDVMSEMSERKLNGALTPKEP